MFRLLLCGVLALTVVITVGRAACAQPLAPLPATAHLLDTDPILDDRAEADAPAGGDALLWWLGGPLGWGPGLPGWWLMVRR
jgi:hypothetical protein